MRTFDYKKRYESLLQPYVVALVAEIHEYKGRQALLTETKMDILLQLQEIAKIQSTGASNRMEGVCTSDERLKKIVLDKTIPKTRSEKELAGYRDVLNSICQNYDYIPVKSSAFLQLHRELYKFAGNTGGRFKSTAHVITSEKEQKNKLNVFLPVSAVEKTIYLDAICEAFQDAYKDAEYDPLLLIPMFILDFLCIQPFGERDERLSRLVTLLMLFQAGYIVGMYSSIENLIEQTKETYYASIQESSKYWYEEKNDDVPFVQYMLEIIAAAYRDFLSKMELLAVSGISKQERVRKVVRGTMGKITRVQIMGKCPDISRVTVERALTNMVKKGEILKIGGGRYTAYIWNREKK